MALSIAMARQALLTIKTLEKTLYQILGSIYMTLFTLKNYPNVASLFLMNLNRSSETISIMLALAQNTTNKKGYEQAVLYLIKNVRPYIKYFDSNKYHSDFSAKNLCIAMGYSGDMVRSIERAKTINSKAKLHYVLPKEGTHI